MLTQTEKGKRNIWKARRSFAISAIKTGGHYDA